MIHSKMTVELDFLMEDDGNAYAYNHPEGNDWIIDISLKKLYARANSNIEKLADKINQLYLREFLCVTIQEMFPSMSEEEFEKVFCHSLIGCKMKNATRNLCKK